MLPKHSDLEFYPDHKIFKPNYLSHIEKEKLLDVLDDGDVLCNASTKHHWNVNTLDGAVLMSSSLAHQLDCASYWQLPLSLSDAVLVCLPQGLPGRIMKVSPLRA